MDNNFIGDFNKADSNVDERTLVKLSTELHFGKFKSDNTYRLYGKIPTEIEKIAVENDGLSDHLIVGTLLGRTSSSVVFISFIIDDDEVDELLKKLKTSHKSKSQSKPSPPPKPSPPAPKPSPKHEPQKYHYSSSFLLFNGPEKSSELEKLGGVYLDKKKYWVFPPSVGSREIEENIAFEIESDDELSGGAQIIERDEYRYHKYRNKYLSLLNMLSSYLN